MIKQISITMFAIFFIFNISNYTYMKLVRQKHYNKEQREHENIKKILSYNKKDRDYILKMIDAYQTVLNDKNINNNIEMYRYLFKQMSPYKYYDKTEFYMITRNRLRAYKKALNKKDKDF